jgi:hypothetical protein
MRRINPTIATLGLLFAFAAAPTPAQAGPAGRLDNAFQLRLGGFQPTGNSTFWSDSETTFTLTTSDFSNLVVGSSYVASLANHLEVGLNVDVYSSTYPSGYRDLVDQDGFPIIHDSTLSMVPLTVDLRLLPAGRYRGGSSGRRALKPVFYIGGGLGANFWEYSETGDFVDFSDPDLLIFGATFSDSGTAFQTSATTGLEVPVSPGFQVTFEGRYSWSKAELKGDLGGLGEIDLGGLALYVGASFRF